MASIHFEGETFDLENDESVLDGLLRNGHAIPSSCRSGVCQSCMVKLESGSVDPKSQAGLTAPQKAAGFFLSCACVPEDDLQVTLPSQASLRVGGVVEEVQPLSARVRLLRVRPDAPFEYCAGQFVNLVLADGTLRSYSVAGVPGQDETLDFHIALLPGGAVSEWLRHSARPGDRVQIQGPLGACFYTPEAPDQPMLLAGTGTGLAPLYGIVRDALKQGHRGPIHLYHGCLDAEGLYLVEELQALAAAHDHLSYTPCVLNGPAPDGVLPGNLEALVMERFPSLKGHRVYLCGHPDFVKSMQRKTFIAGASLGAIFADAFLPSKTTSVPA